MSKLNNKGIGHHLLLLVVAVVAVAGAAGYFVWNRQKDSGIDAKAQVGCWQRFNNGARGDCVKHIQTFLNELSNAKLTIDGVYGAKTVAAVKDYQKANKLTVDGIVATAETWPSFCRESESKMPNNNNLADTYVNAGCDKDNYDFKQKPRLTACMANNKTMRFVKMRSSQETVSLNVNSKWRVSFTESKNLSPKSKASKDLYAKTGFNPGAKIDEPLNTKSEIRKVSVDSSFTHVSSSIDNTSSDAWKFIPISSIPKCQYN